jgi:hypothetical protein
VVTGAGFLVHKRWWGACGAASGTLALVVMLLCFSPWPVAGIVISAFAATYGGLSDQQAPRPTRRRYAPPPGI